MSNLVPDEDFRTDIDVRARDRLVVVSIAGTLTLERLASLGPMVREGRAMTAEWGVIYDFSGASLDNIFRADLEALAAELANPSPNRMYRVAYVVPSDLSFGLARMYAVLAEFVPGEGPRARFVTRTRAEALEWMQGRFSG